MAAKRVKTRAQSTTESAPRAKTKRAKTRDGRASKEASREPPPKKKAASKATAKATSSTSGSKKTTETSGATTKTTKRNVTKVKAHATKAKAKANGSSAHSIAGRAASDGASKPASARAKGSAKPSGAAKAQSTAASGSKKTVVDRQSTPAAVYGGVVAEIINTRDRRSAFRPKIVMSLSIVRRRQPSSVSELHRDEREQLSAILGDDLASFLGDEELAIEAAEVVDEKGTLRYRLYGWNFGVGYLFPPKGLEVIGFGAQHDIEHWSLPQRDIFFAMDQALRKKGHGFEQPLSFCWWDDACWSEIDTKKPGTMASEPNIRKRLAERVQALS